MVSFDKRYRTKGLQILGFPCNQFASQEPGKPQQIREFVNNYGVEFQMFEKIRVNPPNAHPLYKFLKREKSGFLGGLIKWNFTKFIIDKEGKVVMRLGPKTSMKSREEKICELLGCDLTEEVEVKEDKE